jgi:hypothetical protein
MIFMQCQAKDFAKRIGPYEVNFTLLPDEIALNTKVDKTTVSGVTLNGIAYDKYSINLLTPITNSLWGYITIIHYNTAATIDPAAAGESIKKNRELDGYTCSFDKRTIDEHDGYLVECQTNNESYYRFGYTMDNQTFVDRDLELDWDTTVLFLKYLHVKKVE